MNYLLDTCVISEAVRKQPAPTVLNWLQACAEESLFLSALTIGELAKGVAKLPDSPRKAALQAWVARDLTERFSGRILPVDSEVAARWGRLVGESERRGIPLPVIDSLIAATSLVHDLVVVTRNVDDIVRCGARCFNPWDAPSDAEPG